MNDLLEKAIRENKEVFVEDAPEGHFERFEVKLNKEFEHRNKHQNRNRRKRYFQVAATMVFVLLLGNQLRIYLAPQQQAASPTLSSISAEYKEVEFYFTSAIDQNMNEWEKLNKAGFIGETDRQMMKKEMEEFDKMQVQLQNELKANPGDQRVINAILEYYQAKLSVINMIISKLEEVKHLKSTYNETEI